ncbi:MAG: hypothetical protein BTN85_1254 [Candidatus Methanohalarchaeum thermophilum]|uniref:Uncharacterized protein n=1 Tax=Methanohalarchaeum thermophilum TaxID=1903181 RepID=A0A1Q6DWK6_METT1|nr:MAG: hypothetical protein BTN85_1254 [Candidatus Methanohalarchaeum thermophilum]
MKQIVKKLQEKTYREGEIKLDKAAYRINNHGDKKADKK